MNEPHRGSPGWEALDRSLREEVDRVRRAERAAEAALEELRGSRERLEALVGRVIAERKAQPAEESFPVPAAPSEIGARAASRRPGGRRPEASPTATGADAAPGETGSEESESGPEASLAPGGPARAAQPVRTGPEPEEDSRLVPLAVTVLVILVAALGAGWLAREQGLLGVPDREVLDLRGTQPDPSPDGASPSPDGALDPTDPAEAPAPGAPASPPDDETAPTADRVVVPLPTAPDARAAVYDSLWDTRSPAFDPLLTTLADETGHEAVEDAVQAWRNGGELGPLAADLLHSALVQLVLRRELGVELTLDGQLLRNPCRGSSCTALMRLWEEDGERFGLPAMPDDAARRPERLAVAEKAVLLAALREGTGRGVTPPGAPGR